MSHLRSILVPVDFYNCSLQAVDYAAALAETFGAKVDLLHAWTSPAYVSPSLAVQIAEGKGMTRLEDVAHADASRRMESFLKRLRVPQGVTVGHRIVYEDPVTAILNEADQYDLVVTGTHGRTGMSHLVLGSVAEKVLQHCGTPVLTVRTQEPYERPRPIRRILLPVDFSDSSREALRFGAFLAEKLGVEADILHVVAHVPAIEGTELLVVTFSGESKEPFEEWAKARAVEEMRMFLSADAGHLRHAINVEIGNPAMTINKVADQRDYDLVVMGTRGRTGLKRLLMGSVATKVVRHAPCPVLTVRTPADNGENLG